MKFKQETKEKMADLMSDIKCRADSLNRRAESALEENDGYELTDAQCRYLLWRAKEIVSLLEQGVA